jgi:hypothetical protein
MNSATDHHYCDFPYVSTIRGVNNSPHWQNVESATLHTCDYYVEFPFFNLEGETQYRRYGLRESIFYCKYVRELESQIEMYQQLWDLCQTDVYSKKSKNLSRGHVPLKWGTSNFARRTGELVNTLMFCVPSKGGPASIYHSFYTLRHGKDIMNVLTKINGHSPG